MRTDLCCFVQMLNIPLQKETLKSWISYLTMRGFMLTATALYIFFSDNFMEDALVYQNEKIMTCIEKNQIGLIENYLKLNGQLYEKYVYAMLKKRTDEWISLADDIGAKCYLNYNDELVDAIVEHKLKKIGLHVIEFMKIDRNTYSDDVIRKFVMRMINGDFHDLASIALSVVPHIFK